MFGIRYYYRAFSIDKNQVVYIEALGFFGAYHVSSKEIYIESDIIEEKQRKVLFGNDCWKLDSSTVNTPEWWAGRVWD